MESLSCDHIKVFKARAASPSEDSAGDVGGRSPQLHRKGKKEREKRTTSQLTLTRKSYKEREDDQEAGKETGEGTAKPEEGGSAAKNESEVRRSLFKEDIMPEPAPLRLPRMGGSPPTHARNRHVKSAKRRPALMRA